MDWSHFTIDVVVPCYRHAHLLEDTRRSLANQTIADFGVVWVNDCAPDNTAVVLGDFQTRSFHARQSFLRTPGNVGQAAAINHGVAASNADLLVVLNDDDYLMYDALEAIIVLARKYQCHLLGGSCVPFSGDNLKNIPADQYLIRNHSGPYDNLPYQVRKPTDINLRDERSLSMTHSGSAFTRAAWAAVGGYRKQSDRVVPWADRDFQLRVAAGFGCLMLPAVPFVYWRSDSSVDNVLMS